MTKINEYGYITYDAQPMLEYGFVDFNGNQWNDNNIDSYNQYTKIINKVSPHQQGSICESERNQVIENRHKFFVEMCDFYNARKAA